MNKTDLTKAIKQEAALQTHADAERAVDALINVITSTLADGESITLTGFGTFKVATRAARMGRNPRTGEAINIPASKAVKFTPGKTLKEAVQE